MYIGNSGLNGFYEQMSSISGEKYCKQAYSFIFR